MNSNKENWERFSGPMKQSLKNLSQIKDNISDTIADKMDEMKNSSATEKTDEIQPKKGCLWTVIKWILVLSVLSAILSECGTSDSTTNENHVQGTTQSVLAEPSGDYQLSFVEKQVAYAAEYNIVLHRFPKEEAELAKWLDNSSENVVYVTTDNLFGADKYKITETYNGYLYYGELKNNRPDGYGILFVAPQNSDRLLTYEDRAYVCRYIGQFSDGKIDGFGVLFTESENGYAFLSRLRPYNETTGENVADFLTWANYVEYFGEFSDGYRHGLGNSFVLSDFYIGSFDNALNEVDLDNPSYSIDVGEYKKDQLNGSNKQYIGGYLYYDGESKDDMFNGYGVLYHYGTNIPSYEGEFKNNMRHGSGTSYNENGEIIYQGKWRNDDYA